MIGVHSVSLLTLDSSKFFRPMKIGHLRDLHGDIL
jgi:hypothetical protein